MADDDANLTCDDPFHSDEQPIVIENHSIISATHEEAIQIFNHPLAPDNFESQPLVEVFTEIVEEL